MSMERKLQLQALVDGKKIIITESTVRRDLQLEDAEDEAIHKKRGDSLVRAATTASSLEVEQDRSGGVWFPGAQEDNANGGYDCIELGNELNELIELCTNLQQRVLDLEKTKTTQANEIDSLKRRLRLESSGDEGNVWLMDAYQTGENQKLMLKIGTLCSDEVTLAQALAALKSAQVQEKGDVIEGPSVPVSTVNASTKDSATTTTPTTIIYVLKPLQDKGKGIMIEEPVVEQVNPMKSFEQIRLDEELAFKLQAEEE
ncbi:hypothetical protein Tco_0712513 [Tanacetum coccineum]